jgi:hypothetical protein
MPRDNIPQSATKKLQQFFTKTLGKEIFDYKKKRRFLFIFNRYK